MTPTGRINLPGPEMQNIPVPHLCTWPNCRNKAYIMPVVEIPTIQLREGGWVKTDRPTYLIGTPLCHTHQSTYRLTDWFRESEWTALRDAAHERGFKIPPSELVIITWRPVGWIPQNGYMEVER